MNGQHVFLPGCSLCWFWACAFYHTIDTNRLGRPVLLSHENTTRSTRDPIAGTLSGGSRFALVLWLTGILTDRSSHQGLTVNENATRIEMPKTAFSCSLRPSHRAVTTIPPRFRRTMIRFHQPSFVHFLRDSLPFLHEFPSSVRVAILTTISTRRASFVHHPA